MISDLVCSTFVLLLPRHPGDKEHQKRASRSCTVSLRARTRLREPRRVLSASLRKGTIGVADLHLEPVPRNHGKDYK